MRRALKYGFYGAVVAGLVAVPVVWTNLDKNVDLVVDGHSRTVSTTASDVSGALDGQGYELTSHDIVAPSAHTPVHDGMKIVLRRGRMLHLSVNGAQKTLWTTAPTVQQALGQLGYETSDFVSVSRSRRLPLRASDMTIRTPHRVTVQHDGMAQHATTTVASVGALLNELGITVGPKDTVSVPQSAPIDSDETIRVERVGEKTIARIRTVHFGVRKVSDPTLAQGKTKVVQKGEDGTQRVVYSVLKWTGRTVLSQSMVTPPQNKVVAVGVQPSKHALAVDKPVYGPPSPDDNKAIARELLAKRGWSDQFSCLDQMWTRESGWRTDAENSGSGAYGIPQSLPGSKMAAYGPDWQTDATTQIKWGLAYIAERYGTPCDAWSFWQAHTYY